MALSFRYLIGGAEQPVLPGSPLWKSPLPMDRHHFQHGGSRGGAHGGFAHGDYFSAARRFFEEGASSTPLPESIRNSETVDICLMKHGECYHPAKVTVAGGGRRSAFVLNVAVSETGRRIMDTEIAALKRLAGAPGPSFIPGVHGEGRVSTDGGRTVQMFLGEWFEGYHEFHLSARNPGALCVWGEQDRPFLLSPQQAVAVYHQASQILTRYYNPATTEHIARWHHASGDLVVRCRGSEIGVRLITVRRYAPLLNLRGASDDPFHRRQDALAALLIFLIGLSMRMRLDRAEGIEDMAWADDAAVIGTWSGFLKGLSNSCFPTELLPNPVAQFKDYLATYGAADIHDLAETMVPALPVGPAEKALIETHLDRHVAALIETICRIGFS